MDIQYALDSFYILIAGLLVMWMVVGLTLFEAGMVRTQNTVDILVKNFAVFAVACLIFFLFAYHIMFGTGAGAGKYLPDLHFISAADAFPNVLHAKHYNYLVGVFFQVMLAAVTVSIVSGATAERLKLWPFLFFAVLMAGFIYPIQGYWIWGNGFLHQWGFIDVAGAGVVHVTGACAALVGIWILGPRKGKYIADKRVILAGANMPLVAAGVFMIWMGCFGFNGGAVFAFSQGNFTDHIGAIFLNTLLSGSVGLLVALLIVQVFAGAADLTVMLNGCVAGLIALAASPAAMSMAQVMLVAATAAALVIVALRLLDKWYFDDPVGAVAVHGIGGIVGLLSVAFIDQQHWLLQLQKQLLGVGIVLSWTLVTSFIGWWLIRIVMGLRIKPDDEFKGLDVMGCGMSAYPEFRPSGVEK